MFAVISSHPDDGTLIDEFDNQEKAEVFARDVSAEGYRCTVLRPLRTFEAGCGGAENAGLCCPQTPRPPVAFLTPLACGRRAVY